MSDIDNSPFKEGSGLAGYDATAQGCFKDGARVLHLHLKVSDRSAEDQKSFTVLNLISR